MFIEASKHYKLVGVRCLSIGSLFVRLRHCRKEIKEPYTGEKDDFGELNLMKSHYGVTVILPRGLAEDQEALALLKTDAS